MKNQIHLKKSVLVYTKTLLLAMAAMFTLSLAAELSARYLSNASRKGDVFDTNNFKECKNHAVASAFLCANRFNAALTLMIK